MKRLIFHVRSQFNQCLINLLKNAHEASVKNSEIDLLIKTKGTGIGLSLCKQIIEGHQGQLRLSNLSARD